MGRAQLVVAIRGEHEGRPETVDPAADEGEHVQGRLVRPVQVVEDEDGRPARLQLPDHGARHVVGLGVAVHHVVELTAGLRCDVDEGPERSRREQRVARAPEDACRRVLVVAERSHERRLADARLTADQD